MDINEAINELAETLDVYIIMTRTLDGDIFDCKWKK